MTDVSESLKQCVQEARKFRRLCRGLNECARALDQRQATLCVISNGCTEANYTKLIHALCNEHNIPMMKVDDSELLGEWAGLAKYNEEGEVVKVVKCACVVIQNWDTTQASVGAVLNFIKENN